MREELRINLRFFFLAIRRLDVSLTEMRKAVIEMALGEMNTNISVL